METKTKRRGNINFDELFEQAEIGPKRFIVEPTEPPTIGIKRQGRIVLNKASAEAFRSRGFDYALLLRANNVLFVKSDKGKHKDAHKITYGKGGIPGLITAKSSLKNLGVNFAKNWSDIPVDEVSDKGDEVRLAIVLPNGALEK